MSGVEKTKLSIRNELKPKFKFLSMPETREKPFTDYFVNFAEGLGKCDPGGFVLTPEFGRHIHEFIGFQTRKDDVWVLTFPKCG